MIHKGFYFPNTAFLLFSVLAVVILFFAAVKIFQWLWNITIPQVFNLKELTYWQAFRLLIISSVLFGGMHINM